MVDPWMTPKEAAAAMGYQDVDYWRRVFCDPSHPLVTVFRSRPNAHIKLIRSEIEALIRTTPEAV